MNGCEAERKTSSGPRGLSRTQRGTQIQPLHLEHENTRWSGETRHDERRPLSSTLGKPTVRFARALLVIQGHYPWQIQWEVFCKKKEKNPSKNKYTHVCFSFINFTVYTVSVGLSWEFPCPWTDSYRCNLMSGSAVKAKSPFYWTRTLLFTYSRLHPDASIWFASYVFFLSLRQI